MITMANGRHNSLYLLKSKTTKIVIEKKRTCNQ